MPVNETGHGFELVKHVFELVKTWRGSDFFSRISFDSFIVGVRSNRRAGMPQKDIKLHSCLQIQPFLCAHDVAKLCSRPSASPRAERFSYLLTAIPLSLDLHSGQTEMSCSTKVICLKTKNSVVDHKSC